MKTAFFDLDGTLTDTRDDLTLAVNLTRADYDMPPVTRDVVVGAVGNGVKALIERVFDPMPDDYENILKHYKEYYAEHLLDNTALYPGVGYTLTSLYSMGWKLAVVTNKPGIFARPILEDLGVAYLFGAIIGGGDCEMLKPDPAPIYLAAEKMGVTLDADDWMVGDHNTDLIAGANAGLKTCFCEFGMGQSHGAHYDVAVGRMDDLLVHL